MWNMPALTDAEKRTLQGEEGVVRQKCMQYLVELCQISGAERLVDLDGTCDMHTPGFQLSQHIEITFDEISEYANNGGKFALPTFANKSPFGEEAPIHGWEHCNGGPAENGYDHDPFLRKLSDHVLSAQRRRSLRVV